MLRIVVLIAGTHLTSAVITSEHLLSLSSVYLRQHFPRNYIGSHESDFASDFASTGKIFVYISVIITCYSEMR